MTFIEVGPLYASDVVELAEEGAGPFEVIYDLRRAYITRYEPYPNNYEKNALNGVTGIAYSWSCHWTFPSRSLVDARAVSRIVFRVQHLKQASSTWREIWEPWMRQRIDQRLRVHWAKKLCFQLMDQDKTIRFNLDSVAEEVRLLPGKRSGTIF